MLKIKDTFKKYKMATLSSKIENTECMLNKLNHIQSKVNEFLNEELDFFVLDKFECWSLAKYIFSNEDLCSRGSRYDSNRYYINGLGILKLKFLICINERKLKKLTKVKDRLGG